MYLDVFSDNSFETNCWLLGADGTDEVVVVDPGFSPERVRSMLDAEGRRPVAAFATHGHFDHIGSAAVFCGDDLPFYIHEADVAALTDPQGWGAGFQTPPVPVKDVRTVFAGAIGRSDFPNSSPTDMERSLDRFLELPDTTDVLPGHGPRTTVARERERNRFLIGR